MASLLKITALLGSLALICLVVSSITEAKPMFESSADEETKPQASDVPAGHSEESESAEEHGSEEHQELAKGGKGGKGSSVGSKLGKAGSAAGVGIPIIGAGIKAGQCIKNKGLKGCIKGEQQSESEHAEGHEGGEHAEGE